MSHSVRWVASDGLRVGFATRFAPGLKEAFRTVHASWSPALRMWVTDCEHALEVAPLLAGNAAGDLRRMIYAAISRPDRECFAAHLDVQAFPVAGGGTAISCRFDSHVSVALKGLSGRWYPDLRMWLVRAPVAEVLGALEERACVARAHVYVHPKPVQPWALSRYSPAPPRPKLDAGADGSPKGEEALAASRSDDSTAFTTALEALAVDEAALAVLAAQASLYDYQVDGVRHLARYNSALLADDMGLGKTLQAVTAAKLVCPGGRVLIACPASLRINWEREIARIDARPVAIAGESGDEHAAAWVIASFERLGAFAQDMTAAFGVFIVDEAHFLKEPDTARTRNAFAVAARVPHRILLTGTPVLNREDEIHTLLKLSGHPIGRLPLPRFRRLYAGSTALRDRLAERLREWMLRRDKIQVQKWLPGKREIAIPLPTTDAFRERYAAVRNDDTERVLVKIGVLRRLCEEARVDFMADRICGLAAQEKVIVFCEYIDTVAALAEILAEAGLRPVTLVGENDLDERQAAVDGIQNDPAVRVLVTTTRAGGVGLNLTAASAVVFASLPWTPALKRQAEDRANRNGQTRPVTVYVPYFPGTLDEDVIRLLDYKAGIEREVLGESEARGMVAREVFGGAAVAA